jgi:hypothetical protein
MKLRQQSARSQARLTPPAGKNAERAGFMQDMFRAAQFSSKDTVTEAEIDFCPTAMEDRSKDIETFSDRTLANKAFCIWRGD